MWYFACPPTTGSNAVNVAGYPGGPQNRSSWRGSVNASHRRSCEAANSAVSVMVRASGSVVTAVTGISCSFCVGVLGVLVVMPCGRGRGFGEDRVEAVDTGAPQLLVAGEQCSCAGDHGRIRPD